MPTDAAQWPQRLLELADACYDVGFRIVRGVAVDERAALDAWADVAPALEARGFVPARACSVVSPTVRAELRRRHVALLVLDRDRGGEQVRRWVRDLGTASPRAHLLALVSTGGPFDVPREVAVGWDVSCEAARQAVRWKLRRDSMSALHDVSGLVQLVHDAEDEHAALRHGCAWVREHTGADGVAIANADGAFMLGDGLGRVDLAGADLPSAPVDRSRTVAAGAQAIVTTPIRSGGVRIGLVVVKGRRDAAAMLSDAAMALASACAPALRARLDALAVACAGHALAPEILGASPAIVSLRETVARAAVTAFPVLVEGESGTGKELVARALHRLSARRDRRLCAINCAALTDELLEAELFGHVRGAFTGAIGPRVGLFEEAHAGTLFLDEVSELSARAQAKLLRVLQEREIRRLGENGARPVDVRVIAATNQHIAEAVTAGRFRLDLLFRLAVVRIRVPPLRDRVEDIPLLTHTFWRRLALETGKRAQLGPDAAAALCRYDWPGNVRELQNVVAALIVSAPTRGQVGSRHVAEVLADGRGRTDVGHAPLDAARREFERRIVAAALARHGGRRGRAATDLGLSRQGLTKAIKRLGLEGMA